MTKPYNKSITCPKCDTKFNVTPSQLSSTPSVRCGNCYHLFRVKNTNQKVSSKQSGKKNIPVDTSKKNIPVNRKKAFNKNKPIGTKKTINTQSKTPNKLNSPLSQKSTSKNHKVSMIIAPSQIKILISITAGLLFLALTTTFIMYKSNQTQQTKQSQYSNVSAIKNLELLVRTNPEKPGYIIADIIILNQAERAQQWPNLVLSFSDIDNDILLQKTFHSNEYLGGELANSETMPPKKAIKLSLDMLDPGKKAISYKLTITPQ